MRALLIIYACAAAAFSQAPEPPAPPPVQKHVSWQRTLKDALATQQETGLPLLIAVNMDGEVFNENFAKSTYKDQTFIASTENYICVIASPDRHTERDYDALGNRIECPRFKGCTCSEHINIEPELYRRYFNKKRNAPRHVGVSTDGEVMFDRYLDNRMSVAIQAIAKHEGKANQKHLKTTDNIGELFRRRDAMARSLLEQRYRNGNKQARIQLLKSAATAKNEPLDLLRIGLRSPDEQLVGLAAVALSATESPDSLIDIEDALARITDQGVRKQLIEQLRRLGKEDPNAARMASHFERTKTELAQPWRNEWLDSPLCNGRMGIEAELDRIEAAIRTAPDSNLLRFQLATAQAAFANILMQEGGSGIELWLADAERNAKKVTDESLQKEISALLTYTSWYQSDGARAKKEAGKATASGTTSKQPNRWLATHLMDVLLQLTAQTAFSRSQEDDTKSLSGEVARTQSILDILNERGAGEERGLLAGIALLEFAGLRGEAQAYLKQVVDRFPASVAVHEKWRNRMLVDLGAEAMRHRYAKFASEAKDRPTAQWYAGYASLVAGDRHTLDKRLIEAENAYSDSIERFLASASANEEYVATAHHYAALALAARAHIRHVRDNDKEAVKDLVRAAELAPESMDLDDGLKRKPRAIASRIHATLLRAGKAELAEQLVDILP
jgi:hypothetical protein